MSFMIEITEHKLDEMSDCVEKMLRVGGKLMSCLDSMKRDSSRHSERSPMSYRDGRMGWRDDDEDDERDDMGDRYGDRRGVRGTGRYSRY